MFVLLHPVKLAWSRISDLEGRVSSGFLILFFMLKQSLYVFRKTVLLLMAISLPELQLSLVWEDNSEVFFFIS